MRSAPPRAAATLVAFALLAAFARPPVGAADPPTPAETPAQLAASAKAVLSAHCYRCHGKDGADEGGFRSVLDRRRLVDGKQVTPGDAAKSRLLRRVTAGEMPPPEEKVTMPAADIAALTRWVEGGAPDWTAAVGRKPITLAEEVGVAALDLAKQTVNPGEAPRVRYFSLTPLYNAGGTDDELDELRVGFFKLLNSFSDEKQIVLPEPVNPEKTVYRVVLAAFGRTWLDDRGHPFGLALRVPEAGNAQAAAPVRMDWFVAAASRAELYNLNAGIPKTLKELEGRLKVESAGNIRDAAVIRSAFNGSGISRHNRMIERHEGADGYYWKSYDFAGSTGRRNLFAFPVGPGAAAAGDTFTPDGGEIIFRLPNGLHGYMLVDGRGNRLDRGPTDIVTDPKHPEKVVENGRSCLSCHAGGLIPKADQLRPLAEQPDASFPAATRAAVLALHPPRETFAAAVAADAADYRKALAALGAKADAPDPVSAAARRYEAEVDLRRAAAEMWVTPEKLVAALKGLPADSPVRAGALPLLVPGGTVKRDAFESLFSMLVYTTSPAVTRHAPLEIPVVPKSRRVTAGPADPYRAGSRTVVAHKSPLLIDPTFRLVAAVAEDRTQVELRDLPTNEVRHTLPPGQGLPWAFSPDGSVFATFGRGGGIRFTDTLTGREISSAKDRVEFPYMALAFSPDGKELAAVAGDGPMRYFDPAAGRLVRAVGKAHFRVGSLQYLPDGKLLQGGGYAVDPKTDIARPLREADRTHRVFAVSPDGKHIGAVSAVANTVAVYDLATLDRVAEERVSFVGGPASSNAEISGAVAFSPDGGHLVAAHQGGFLTVWTNPGLKVVRAVRCHPDQPTALRFTPDGKRLVAHGDDGVIRFWDWSALRKTDD